MSAHKLYWMRCGVRTGPCEAVTAWRRSSINRGAPKRLRRGVTCSPALNRNGEGVTGRPGRAAIFHCDLSCPIHGTEIARHAIHAGQARVIPPPDDCGAKSKAARLIRAVAMFNVEAGRTSLHWRRRP